MKKSALLLLFVSVLMLAGCATVESRIEAHQAEFDRWPADVQAAVRAGKIDVGYTQEQVTVAVGRPDRVFTRATETGTEEIWAYFDKGPRFSIGVGVATGGYSGVGGGMHYRQQDDSLDDATRVVFKDGKVTAIEVRQQ